MNQKFYKAEYYIGQSGIEVMELHTEPKSYFVHKYIGSVVFGQNEEGGQPVPIVITERIPSRINASSIEEAFEFIDNLIKEQRQKSKIEVASPDQVPSLKLTE